MYIHGYYTDISPIALLSDAISKGAQRSQELPSSGGLARGRMLVSGLYSPLRLPAYQVRSRLLNLPGLVGTARPSL